VRLRVDFPNFSYRFCPYFRRALTGLSFYEPIDVDARARFVKSNDVFRVGMRGDFELSPEKNANPIGNRQKTLVLITMPSL
jgi:hypothetical protein